MKLSDKTYIIILLIVISVISLLGRWRFEEFKKSFGKVELPKIETQEIGLNLEDLLVEEEEEGYKDWSSPDKIINLHYSSEWIRLDEALLESSGQTEAPTTEYEVLFFASLVDLRNQATAILTVSGIDPNKSLEEIITMIEQDNQKQESETKVTKTEAENGTVWLEIVSEYPNQPNFYSKARLIFAKETTYLIVFSTPEENWSKLEKKANEILNSAY